MIYAEKAWNQNTQRLRLSKTDKIKSDLIDYQNSQN